MTPLVFYFTFFLSLMVLTPLHAGQVTLSTTYPSPTGSYQKLSGIGFQLQPTDLNTVENLYQCALPGDFLWNNPYTKLCKSGLMYYDQASNNIYVAQSNGVTGQWVLISGSSTSSGLDIGSYSRSSPFNSDTVTSGNAFSGSASRTMVTPIDPLNPGGATSLSGYTPPAAQNFSPMWNNLNSLSNTNFSMDGGSTPSCITCGVNFTCSIDANSCVDNVYPTDIQGWRVNLDTLSATSITAGYPPQGRPPPSNAILAVNLQGLPRGTVTLNYSWNIDLDEYVNEEYDENLHNSASPYNRTASNRYYNPFYYVGVYCNPFLGSPPTPPANIYWTCIQDQNVITAPSTPNVNILLQKWSWAWGWNGVIWQWMWEWVTIDSSGALTDVGQGGDDMDTSLVENTASPYDSWVNPWTSPRINTYGNTTASRTYSWPIGSQPKSFTNAVYFFRVVVQRKGVVGHKCTGAFGNYTSLCYDVPLAVRINNLNLTVQYQ